MKRAYEALLQEYLKLFPCVAIIGPRQCGKTTLLKTLPPPWKRYDLERRSDFQVVSRDPDLFLRMNPRAIAVDEAQLLPEVFAALRVAIDDARSERGRFVVTGSSSPGLLRSVSESLAGRVGLIEMAPLSWAETHPKRAPSFLARLRDPQVGPAELLEGLTPRGDVRATHDYWFRGGYPEPWLDGTAKFRSAWMEQYTQTYLFRDIGRLFPGLDQVKFRLFLQLLAGLSGNVLNYSEVARALGVSQPTARDYFEIAHGTFLWRKIPAYTRDALRRVAKHPRGHLRDSGLLHHLLHVHEPDALLAHPRMGLSWQGMVIEEIIRQLTCLNSRVEAYHYRTSGGGEIDLVLEGDFGLVPVEIKYPQSVDRRDVRCLCDFVKERGARIGIVINNDVAPRRYDEAIIGVPFAFL